MDDATVALLLSALSLLVAGLALGWNVAVWLLAGGRPKATLMHGIVHGQGAYVGPVAKDGKRIDLLHLFEQGIRGPEMIGIQVTNLGRAPVVVQRVSVLARGGRVSFVPHGTKVGPDLPHRIEPGTNATWYVELADAALLASSSREVLRDPVKGVLMSAELGTGKTVKTRNMLCL